MIYLSAHQSSFQWVGYKEVACREIKGTFKRFIYYCNGHQLYIYCRNKDTFFKLFAHWTNWARIYAGSKTNPVVYLYTLDPADMEGEDIALEDIVMDRPEGTKYRPKVLVLTQYGEYIQ